MITQGIGVVTGMQDKFNWTAVAAAGLGAMAGQYLKGRLPSDMQYEGLKEEEYTSAKVFGSGLAAMANTLVQSGIQGNINKLNWGEIAVNSFGQALGDSIETSMVQADQKKAIAEQAKTMAAAYEMMALNNEEIKELAYVSTPKSIGEQFQEAMYFLPQNEQPVLLAQNSHSGEDPWYSKLKDYAVGASRAAVGQGEGLTAADFGGFGFGSTPFPVGTEGVDSYSDKGSVSHAKNKNEQDAKDVAEKLLIVGSLFRKKIKPNQVDSDANGIMKRMYRLARKAGDKLESKLLPVPQNRNGIDGRYAKK